jgi:hypothetical protein
MLDCLVAASRLRGYVGPAFAGRSAFDVEAALGSLLSVTTRGPFRYPGVKTWCVPEIRQWLCGLPRLAVFIEPFAGGAVGSLTAAV